MKAKLAVTFFQVVLLLPVRRFQAQRSFQMYTIINFCLPLSIHLEPKVVYHVRYPTAYITFLKVFEIVNVNVVELFQLGCISSSWNFYSSVVFSCTLPLYIGLLFAIGAIAVSQFVPEHKRRSMRYGQLVRWFLMLLYCIYPSVAYFVFQVLAPCESFDDNLTLLRADYSIDCSTNSHEKYVAFAGVMTVVYPLGVPVLYLAALWPYRKEVSDAQLRESDGAKSTHLAFFYADYKPSFWYERFVSL